MNNVKKANMIQNNMMKSFFALRDLIKEIEETIKKNVGKIIIWENEKIEIAELIICKKHLRI